MLEAVAPSAAAVKFQSAYFERFHGEGVDAYYSLIHEARSLGLIAIGDVKRGDIGSTAAAYAAGHLLEPEGQSSADGERVDLRGDVRLASDPAAGPSQRQEVLSQPDRAAPDAITINPYLGIDGVAPFISMAAELGKGVFVLVRTSNPSAGQLQDFANASGKKLYEHVADLVESWASQPGLVGGVRLQPGRGGGGRDLACPGSRTPPAHAALSRPGARLRRPRRDGSGLHGQLQARRQRGDRQRLAIDPVCLRSRAVQDKAQGGLDCRDRRRGTRLPR